MPPICPGLAPQHPIEEPCQLDTSLFKRFLGAFPGSTEHPVQYRVPIPEFETVVSVVSGPNNNYSILNGTPSAVKIDSQGQIHGKNHLSVDLKDIIFAREKIIGRQQEIMQMAGSCMLPRRRGI